MMMTTKTATLGIKNYFFKASIVTPFQNHVELETKQNETNPCKTARFSMLHERPENLFMTEENFCYCLTFLFAIVKLLCRLKFKI